MTDPGISGYRPQAHAQSPMHDNMSFICSRLTCKCGFAGVIDGKAYKGNQPCTILDDSKKAGVDIFALMRESTKKEKFGPSPPGKPAYSVTNGSVVLNGEYVEFAYGGKNSKC